MKKKIIAIVCVVLMLVGSVGVAKAAGICPPHSYSTKYSHTIQDGEYYHMYTGYNYYDGVKVEFQDWCAVCCEIDIYEYVCDNCGHNDGESKREYLEYHSTCWIWDDEE